MEKKERAQEEERHCLRQCGTDKVQEYPQFNFMCLLSTVTTEVFEKTTFFQKWAK